MRTESGGMGKKRLVKDGMGMERKGTREANSNSSQQRSDINDTLGNHHTEFVHYIGPFGIYYLLCSVTGNWEQGEEAWDHDSLQRKA